VTLDGSAIEGADVRTLSSSEFSNGMLTLNFEDATEMEAGKPYIIKWDAATDLVNPTFTDVTISDATANVETTYADFRGTYAPIDYAADDRSVLFLGATNTLYYPQAGAHIGAFRSYFTLNNGLTASDISHARLLFGDDETTSLSEEIRVKSEEGLARRPEGESQFAPAQWYTLDGRKLQGKPSKRGLYINNGLKVVVK